MSMTEVPKVPKTPEEELKVLIDSTCKMFEWNKTAKSNPIKAMWREGELTYEFVMKEINLIAQKKSNLSAGKRAVVTTLVATAIEHFTQRQASQAARQEKEKDSSAEDKEQTKIEKENNG